MSKIISIKNFSINNQQLTISNSIVMVTGCFDILHQAHKDFLKQAKKQGDILIVGLESDQRVEELKGKNRPINTWQKRAENLAKVKEIDYIVPLPESFGQKDQLKLLQLIKPMVLAVSENTPYLKEKKMLIEKINGKLFIFPYNSAYSTTKILDSSLRSG